MTKPALFPIRTDDDYRAALKLAEAVFDAAQEPDPDSAEGAYFEALLALIAAWERKHYPVEPEARRPIKPRQLPPS